MLTLNGENGSRSGPVTAQQRNDFSHFDGYGLRVQPIRQSLSTRRGLIALLLAATLILKLLIPTGFMVDASQGSITVTLCSGTGPMHMQMVMPGMGKHDGDSSDHQKAEKPCAFSGLGAPSLAGADAIQLTAALVFIFATALFAQSAFFAPTSSRLRPPLRGPPTLF